ncbi:TIM barrel protein [Skermania sp. ID1734]|uniref:sugar phosphate isomerase/epimerase family protein n=1 Tax=Skermania sp. ID1734 TaxID=2597516 RepID=UPI00117CD501|nr:sugar phosphate isomerase/epimerase [Skermania sp. ID1734]TSE00978.1 TIM barrel protein [Skermania sp. ID1734]
MSVIHIGTAPDSWGVWYSDDPRQPPYRRFLDEAASAGYGWIELGPYGYLPTDPAQLRDELRARELRLAAGTVFEQLHGEGSWAQVWERARRVAELTAAVGGRHIVVIPQLWRDDRTGAEVEPRMLDSAAWDRKIQGINRLGRELYEHYGVRMQYHPHADSHVASPEQVERFLAETDPDYVSLCLDTGHIAYCGGDNAALIRNHPERIGYLHLKQVDAEIAAKVSAEDLSFGAAVALGAMVEPPLGVPEWPPLLDAIAGLDRDIFAIVEQDMFPCPADAPAPIARRTRNYLAGCAGPAVRFR